MTLQQIAAANMKPLGDKGTLDINHRMELDWLKSARLCTSDGMHELAANAAVIAQRWKAGEYMLSETTEHNGCICRF